MANVEEQVAALADLTSTELRAEWVRVAGAPVPKVSPKLLRLALAWEIQARAYGGLPRRTTQLLDQLGRGQTKTRPARPGTRLVREWQGVAHVVTVGEHGVIRWNDREWQSLSGVARAITGTRWSGPAFFGLKKRVAA